MGSRKQDNPLDELYFSMWSAVEAAMELSPELKEAFEREPKFIELRERYKAERAKNTKAA